MSIVEADSRRSRSGGGKREASSGNPYVIREAIRAGRPVPEGASIRSDLADVYTRYAESLADDERKLLEQLAVFGRPARRELIALLLKAEGVSSMHPLDSLLSCGVLSEHSGDVFFAHGSLQTWCQQNSGGERVRELHRRIARLLESCDGDREEIARHWLRSDAPELGVEDGIEAARRLAEQHQDRRAISFYEEVLLAIPESDPRSRAQVLEESAELYARTGKLSRALSVLDELLRNTTSSVDRARWHGRAGIFSHMAGEVSAAMRHLERGLRLIDDRRSPEALSPPSENGGGARGDRAESWRQCASRASLSAHRGRRAARSRR